MGRICRKGFKSGMKERVGDEKLISVGVRPAIKVAPVTVNFRGFLREPSNQWSEF